MTTLFRTILGKHSARAGSPFPHAVMHIETNTCEGERGYEAARWLRKEWANVWRVSNSGIPIVGFTWYSLIDQATGTLHC